MTSIDSSSRHTTIQFDQEQPSLDQEQTIPNFQEDRSPRWVICVDYGTTYTGVAWILTTGKEQPNVNDIRVVDNWEPGRPIERKVPSVYTYSPNHGAGWGFGVDIEDEFVMRWTKLELEQQKPYMALQSLANVLTEIQDIPRGYVVENDIPLHLTKAPVDVVIDYLTEVAVAVRADICQHQDEQNLKLFPINLVITRPSDWKDDAKNLTFRAVGTAFAKIFSEIGEAPRPAYIRLAAESEACAQYTIHDSKGLEIKNLRVGDCFIVVDAGGGTVDLMWYRVGEIKEDQFRFSRHPNARASGGPYGSTCVDRRFLEFLSDRLDKPEFHGGNYVLQRWQQALLDQFLNVKHKFEGPQNSPDDNLFDLPEGLIGDLESQDPDVRNGKLRITSADVVWMFDESVEGTLDLINQQVAQIRGAGLRVKTVFLSGGYSRSKYLVDRVTEHAKNWRCSVVEGVDTWTAVAKGGVLMGLGIGCDKPEDCIKCPLNIGIVLARLFKKYDHDKSQEYIDTFDGLLRARDHVDWIIAKGDLISKPAVEKTVKVIRKLPLDGFTNSRVVVVTSPDDPGDDRPKRLSDPGLTSDNKCYLNYELGNLMERQGRYRSTRNSKGVEFNQVELQVKFSLNFKFAGVKLEWGNELLRSIRIPFPMS